MSSKGNTTKAEEGLIGQVIHDRFRLEALLGRGNVGVVYRATDIKESRQVAVKIIKFDLAEKGLQANFNRDAEMVANVSHPSAVKILEFGTLNTGGGYIVMEFVEGKTLRELIREQGRIPYQRALKILKSICEPVTVVHQQGVQHRDLKPENIVLPNADNGERVMVIDFGLAKLKEGVEKSKANLTAAGEVMGTPSYMSPEQCMGAGVDERTDIYALGIILYEMLSGKPPFEGNFFGVLQMHMSKPVPPLQPQVPDLPPAVETFVNDLLKKEKSERISSIEEIVRRVDSLLGGSVVKESAVAATAAVKPDRVAAPVEIPVVQPVSESSTSVKQTPAATGVTTTQPQQPAGSNSLAIYIIAAVVIFIGLLAVGHWGLKLF